jgi:hypothetical protein
MKNSKNIFRVILCIIAFFAVITGISSNYGKNEIASLSTQKIVSERTDFSVDEIPYDTYYTMKLNGNCIEISGSGGNTVYKTRNIDVSRFTDTDICKLRQDGIILSCRTDVIETLNYMES